MTVFRQPDKYKTFSFFPIPHTKLTLKCYRALIIDLIYHKKNVKSKNIYEKVIGLLYGCVVVSFKVSQHTAKQTVAASRYIGWNTRRFNMWNIILKEKKAIIKWKKQKNIIDRERFWSVRERYLCRVKEKDPLIFFTLIFSSITVGFFDPPQRSQEFLYFFFVFSRLSLSLM